MQGKLTDCAVANRRKPGLYGDGGGLYLQVSQRGTKSWVYRFMRAGRSRKMGLGALQTVSLGEARRRAAAARLKLLDGLDPIEARELVDVPEEIMGLLGLEDLTPKIVRIGIYFLCFRGKIKYIGKSQNAILRVNKGRTFEFDRVFFKSVSVARLAATEAALIRKYRPPMNRMVTSKLSLGEIIDGTVMRALQTQNGISPSS